MKTIIQKIYKIYTVFLKLVFRVITVCIPIKKNMILFMAFHGRGVLDNPKALYSELLLNPQYSDYAIIWVINDRNSKKVQKGKTIHYQSFLYFYYLARSHYWIINCKLPEYVWKKKGQVYLQTWHGVPLKKIGMDVIETSERKSRSGKTANEIKLSYYTDAQNYDYLISPNPFCTKIFQSAFGVKRTQLLEVGYPRNDVLYEPDQEMISRLKDKYRIPKQKKVVLYAPTWRDDQYKLEGYTFHLPINLKLWENILDDYIILFKPHYLIVNKIALDSEFKDVVKIIDAKADINDLYLISDCLVTDYSSVFFDFALLNRPIYFFMYDLEKYEKHLRGFYLNIYEDLPGKIYRNEEEMLIDVKKQNFDFNKLHKFNARFNCFQTSNCSKKVLDVVLH